MNRRIFIRTDGDAGIGLGHITRCIALSEMVKEDFEISFYCRVIPMEIEAEIVKNGLKVFRIENERSFLDDITDQELVILDGYHFDSQYQRMIKDAGAKLICIDDLKNQEFYADLIINHTPGVLEIDYHAQPYTTFALGLEYALLRPSFLEAARVLRKVDTVTSIFICFGGSDPNQLTLKSLRIAIGFDSYNPVHVVTGAAYPDKMTLSKLVNGNPRVAYHHAIGGPELARIMLASDLAIVPASSIAIEAIACGMTILAGSFVANQADLLQTLLKNGVAEGVDMGDNFETELSKVLSLNAFRQNRSKLDDFRTAISSSKQNVSRKLKQLCYA